jgi:hypothetical protein
MKRDFFTRSLIHEVKSGKSPREAADYLLESGAPGELVEEALDEYAEMVNRVTQLKQPASFRSHERKDWYSGPSAGDTYWPALKHYLCEKGWNADVVDSIDRASTKVVSLLDPPGQDRFQTRGLVLGYVQSGKTANFTAVAAKAADAGYQFFIVLAGLHNALRKQTQKRMEMELIDINPGGTWQRLTTQERDFLAPADPPAAFFSDYSNARILCVIKKNPSRLRQLVRWLRSSPTALRDTPVLVIDDEADQASLNTGSVEDRSTINQLILDLLQCMPRSAYVGYTATPFANVLSDPSFPDGLYPKDFIVDLPKPKAYFGAERIFGTEPIDHDNDEDDSLNLLRLIPETELELLKPKSRASRNEFDPEMTDSLRDAIDWFVLACAARLARGQRETHMTMLVHTTLYTDVHGRFKQPIESELTRLTSTLRPGHAVKEKLKALWEKETEAIPATEMDESPLTWDEVQAHVGDVLNDIAVVIDNGASDNRLSYEANRSIQIVIGGNTLSRGLTLEGLMVSFFLRASTTYDTLLQMGRWFGYRIGYSDLPRIWMTADLQSNFQHLARVEAEIRSDVARYERENCSPRDFGVNIQAHSTLAITSKMKMQHAKRAKMSFNKAVKQTTFFRHRDAEWLQGNHRASQRLLKRGHSAAAPQKIWGRHWLYTGVNVRDVLDFFDSYKVHETHGDMQPELIGAYVRAQQEAGNLIDWNVAVIGQLKGKAFTDLLPDGLVVNFINRSRLEGKEDADLKAIMSQTDRAVDFGLDTAPSVTRFKTWSVEKGFFPTEPSISYVDWCADHRSPIGDESVPIHPGLRRPLILLYPIEPESPPAYPDRSRKSRQPREALNAAHPVIGLAIIFPQSQRLLAQDYWTVDLSTVEREEADLEEVEEEET